MWEFNGKRRPDFALPTGPGQESVWDYPRPPTLVPDGREVVVGEPGNEIARTSRAIRVLETASPPTFYLPPEDVDLGKLHTVAGGSWCEWKGRAHYFAVQGSAEPVAWAYAEPSPEFLAIAGYISFYPGRIRCLVDDQRVRPQAGGFYGGWVTDQIVGPCKGEPGTGHW